MGNFVNRDSQFPNRRRLEIISQTPNEIIANIYREEGEIYTSGTSIDKDTFNNWDSRIKNNESLCQSSNETAQGSLLKSQEAKNTAEGALNTSQIAEEKADTAIGTATNALEIANGAKLESSNAFVTANEALTHVVGGLGTKVYVGNSDAPATEVIFSTEPQEQIDINKNQISANSTQISNIQSQFSNYLPITGGTLIGDLTLTTLNVTTINLV